MNDAVFISDLHLHPNEPQITARFDVFIEWALQNARSVYILGDFFHAWPGDDALDAWSRAIAMQLARLATAGIPAYFMPGNRDFLLGKAFAEESKLIYLPDPYIVQFKNETVVLTHGDRYCTRDTGHQCLRLLTRNRLFTTLFLKLPYRFRGSCVQTLRQHSQMNRHKSLEKMAISAKSMLKHLKHFNADVVVHGHIHQPGVTSHATTAGTSSIKQYVLSDWDENPLYLCYNETTWSYFDSKNLA